MWHSSRADCANASHASALRTTRSSDLLAPDLRRDASTRDSAVSDAAATSSAMPPPGTTRPPFASVRWTRRTSRPTSPARASATSRTGWHRTAVTRRGVSFTYVAERYVTCAVREPSRPGSSGSHPPRADASRHIPTALPLVHSRRSRTARGSLRGHRVDDAPVRTHSPPTEIISPRFWITARTPRRDASARATASSHRPAQSIASTAPAAPTAAQTSSTYPSMLPLDVSVLYFGSGTSPATRTVLHVLVAPPDSSLFLASIASRSPATPTTPPLSLHSPVTCRGSRGTNKPGTTLELSAGTPATTRVTKPAPAAPSPAVRSSSPTRHEEDTKRSTAAASTTSTSPGNRSRSKPSTSAATSNASAVNFRPGRPERLLRDWSGSGSEPKSPRVLTVADARSMASAIARVMSSVTPSRVMSRTPAEAFARASSAAAAAAS
mmetsp:Transcript_13364/g.60141  ORF Transcript_13364/g.60141 Transcript_13364/m.60141 type:complete len:438 (+) Transcript_13364:990-2303(+)